MCRLKSGNPSVEKRPLTIGPRVRSIRLTTLFAFVAASAWPANGEQPKQASLSQQERDAIISWIADLDADEYRQRVAAQSALEKLRGERLEFAKLHLKESLSLEYMTRRRRILTRFELTGHIQKIEQEFSRFKKTGKSSVPGLGAFARIVGSDANAPKAFYELHQSRKAFLVTVYAAPKYAHDAVQHEIRTAFVPGREPWQQTDEGAIRWISIFLTLCDSSVQFDEEKANRELHGLARSKSIGIALGMADRQHGDVLRELVRKFIATGGERGDEFAKEPRAALAKRFPLLFGHSP